MKTSQAFTDGKTSHEYRRDRFASVLSHFSLHQDHAFMDEVISTYERTIMASLQLVSGAVQLLRRLRDLGKKIAVITEGPQDAQEITVERLRISGYIDFLATTNRFGVAKTEGLFAKVLEHLDVRASDMIYIGDSEQRDTIPATSQAIFSIHYDSNEHVALDSRPLKVNTLWKLQHILVD
ncbi:HAD-like domain-containing protein [Camillea tinctor]|nr:HAD-like domain-containing protein [Camillea tinctor]